MAASIKKSGYVDSWQHGKNLAQCNLHMLETKEFCDVSFRVGTDGHVIRAHSYVLVSRSSVFNAMLCGPKERQGEITIPDVEPGIFKDFLRFVYTENVTITHENCAGLQFTARKFNIQTLFEETMSFLENSLCEENVAELLEHSHFHDDLDLEAKALTMLTMCGPETVKSQGFMNLCSVCFGKFLQSDKLNLREEEIFEAAMAWTKEHCERKGLTPTHANMRVILGELVYEIRFVSMTTEFLVTTVGPSGILTSEERHAVMDRKFDPNIDIKPFKSDHRRKENFLVQRFTSYDLDGWDMEEVHAVSFSPSRKIFLVGCRPFAEEDSGSAEMVLFDDQDKRIAGPVKASLAGGEEFLFPGLVPLLADRTYTICVDVGGNSCVEHVGVGGVESVCSEGVTFTFRDSAKTMSETCVRRGLIVSLICQHAA